MTAAQFDPATMLKRYEWFKDASAQCEKKLADIKVYENRFKQLKSDYGDKPRIEWAREDREQYNLWTSEVAGVEASYNTPLPSTMQPWRRSISDSPMSAISRLGLQALCRVSLSRTPLETSHHLRRQMRVSNPRTDGR